MVLNEINLRNCDIVRNAVMDALKKVEIELGLKFEIGNVTVDRAGAWCRFRTTANVPSRVRSIPVAVQQPTETAHKGILESLGCPLGTKFRHKTKIFEVLGYKAGNPKNNILLRDQNGREFRGADQFVKRCISLGKVS